MRLAAGAQLPLFQASGANQDLRTGGVQPIWSPGASVGAPQLMVLPGVNIQVRSPAVVPSCTQRAT